MHAYLLASNFVQHGLELGYALITARTYLHCGLHPQSTVKNMISRHVNT